MADSAFRVEFDPASFRDFLAAAKGAEPAIATALRRNLRRAGDDAVQDMRRTVTSAPARYNVGVRAGIAAGLKTSVATGKRRQGVRMTGTAARIPEGHKPMLRLFNKESFRRRVYGSPHAWVIQQGRPFFGSVIRRHEDEMVDAIFGAFEDAAQRLGWTS